MENNIFTNNKGYLDNLILELLEEIKQLILENKVEFQSSSKNMATFRELRRTLGITYDDFKKEILETILQLERKDYYDGPNQDNKPERGLIFWKFSAIIFEIEIYLKLTIEEENKKKVVLWSYHIPDYPLNK